MINVAKIMEDAFTEMRYAMNLSPAGRIELGYPGDEKECLYTIWKQTEKKLQAVYKQILKVEG